MDAKPGWEDAVTVVREYLGSETRSVVRLPMGLTHLVFGVALVDGREVVVRMGRRESAEDFTGALYWSRLLAPRGVPLPHLLALEDAPSDGGYPFMIMERLPGQDLYHEYPELTLDQKQALARRIVDIQRSVGHLPPGRGYGYARSYDDPRLHAQWIDVVQGNLTRSRERIEAAGVLPVRHVDRVEAAVPLYARYLAGVPPTPFLDDTTTKNVIVAHGALTGIVDVDRVCFGDPLWTLGLTRMALLSPGYDTAYTDAWTDELALGEEQRRILTFYTAVFAVDFMGEIGHRFNRDAPIPAGAAHLQRLEAILDGLMAQVG
jgi:aminoglycoside phosphotransferase (APT) family kinase protein